MYVYWLHNEITGLHKLGKTNNIKKRVRALENQSGVSLATIAQIQTEVAPQLELLLHRIFQPYRKKGEWFELNTFHEFWLKKFLNSFVNVHVSAEGFGRSLRPGSVYDEFQFSWTEVDSFPEEEKLIEWFGKNHPEYKIEDSESDEG
jgi:uncharacterized protein Usg